jgi:hypothetical protein
MEEGKGKAIRKTDLVDGDKIAIRYFARNELSLADEVFVVVGQFHPEVYQRRRGKRTKASGGSASASGNKAAGGGGGGH